MCKFYCCYLLWTLIEVSVWGLLYVVDCIVVGCIVVNVKVSWKVFRNEVLFDLRLGEFLRSVMYERVPIDHLLVS